MAQRLLYQTLEDRDNPDEVEQNGPYLCKRGNAWVGTGYYFWDTFIDLAHWWGQLNYSDTGYIICKSSCDDKLDGVYDLVGRPELFNEIVDCINVIKNKRKVTTVYMTEVFRYIREKTDFQKHYKAIRFYPERTRSDEYGTTYRINGKNWAYLNTCPEIQFCIIDKSLLTSDYKVVYPERYCSDLVM